MARDMGIGRLGERDIIFKRKFRWTFEVNDICALGGDSIRPNFVKLASRPNITFDETELNFLNGVDWIPGKGKWETITVTYIDIATRDIQPLYTWLSSVYQFNKPRELKMGNRSDWGASAVLTLYDGCGTSLEEWVLRNLWPKAINWGDLDYASSEEVLIELTLRYSQVEYRSLCPTFLFDTCCTGCITGPGGTR